MTLPACNPVDYGWFSKGAAIDHVGTQNHLCKVCEGSTLHEKFVILVGSPVGFGAPFFAKPFMKHSSTKGKIGGTRGHVVQCRQCNSLWAFDQEGAKGFIGHLGPTHHRQGEGTQRRDAIGAVLLAAAKIQTSTSTQDCGE